MPRTLSQRAKRAMFAQETSDAFLQLLTLDHPSLSTPIRVTSDNTDTISNGRRFVRYPFQMLLADDVDGNIREVSLRIDAVDRVIIEAVRRISGAPMTVDMEVVLADTPDVIELGPIHFTMRAVQYDASTVEATLVFEDILNESWPGDTFGPGNFRALF